MGACYDVRLKIGFKNKEKGKNKAIKTMQEYIKIHDGRGVKFNIEKLTQKGITQNTFEELLQIFFGGLQNSDMNIKQGRKWLRWHNGFDASYGWESIMLDIFEVISPFLVDGSEMYIYPDNDYDHLVVKRGKCIMVH